MKHLLPCSLLAAALLLSLGTAAQTTEADPPAASPAPAWTTGGSTGLNFSQVKLSNWAGGGESSISIASLLKLEANYKKGPSLWENRANIAYGLIRQGDREQSRFRKTDDILELRSQYNRSIKDTTLYMTLLADFRTQMGPGYEYGEAAGETTRSKISEFMAPGFLLTSLGATYKIPERFTLTVSPVTGKFTFVQDPVLSAAGAFGVEAGERMRSEFGASLVSNYKRELLTNVDFNTSLLLFANYETLSRVDVNWEATLMMKVNRYINTTIATQLIYDHDVLQKTQFRNVINVGFLFQWPGDRG
ncbi:DUF3078 domain-containing protein [Cesiribacter andamanensis]|uniref:DUF3078 domain-containing protein n=1 Tax=Cesiribacter andamanensis AMV16 TaxID=1279009 RepID=M7N873_9BACT|nr:DUF3078 domain-containing protein [Cesiribacter andamanensis]EMR03411.1 hypothetical protein ADICEAN_01433 [Cesiribacter andamanensis AMV16]